MSFLLGCILDPVVLCKWFGLLLIGKGFKFMTEDIVPNESLPSDDFRLVFSLFSNDVLIMITNSYSKM